jgi:hypothetical protein
MDGRDPQRPQGRLPDGVGGLVGARLRIHDLRDRAGVGPARAHRGRAVGRRREAHHDGNGAGGGIELVLLRGDCDRQEPVRQGRLGIVIAGVRVRVDEPRVGARTGAVGADRLAVHDRRVPGRHRDDRPDGAAAARVRLPRARGTSARARPGGGHRPPAPHGRRAHELARAAHVDVGLVRRRAQLPRRLADALQGDRDRIPPRRVRRPTGQWVLQRAVSQPRPRDRPVTLGGADRPGDRGAELRLLGRQRPGQAASRSPG